METVRITDPASGSTASIAAHLGFNCYEFQAAVNGGPIVDVLDTEESFLNGGDRFSASGIPILFPFPNRIRHGKFSWEGTDYEMPPEKVGYNADNAIHGFCLDRPWRVIDQAGDSVTGEFQLTKDAPDRADLWPADFILRLTYRVAGANLICDVEVENPDSRPLPWGFGTHAYFKLPLGKDSDPKHCLIEAPAHQQWELDACMPTGKIGPVAEAADLRTGAYYDVLKLDDVLTGLEAEGDTFITTIYDEAAGLQLTQRFDRAFRELVVFTPPWTKAICLEPYTCMTDAINLHQQGIDGGLQVLPPDAKWNTRIEIEAGLVMA